MAQSKTQSWQIVNDTALTYVGAVAREGLDSILSKLDTRAREVGGLSVTGSSLVVTVDATTLSVGPDGRRKGLAPISGVDVSNLSGTFDLGTGVGTGSVQTATLPTLLSSGVIRVGFEVRTDKKIYALYGTPGANLAAAGVPGFSSGATPLGEVQVTITSSALVNPTMASVILFGTGAGGGGSGSGTGVKNYLVTSDAEIDVSSFSTYADAAGSTPVDATGGAPTVTLTRNTTNPLFGTADYQLNKPASNCQGQGVSSTLKALDGFNQAGYFEIQVPYKTGGTYAANDVRAFLVDATNNQVAALEPTAGLLPGTNVLVGRVKISSSSTTLRLALHCSTPSTAAYTLNFDEPIVTPYQPKQAISVICYQQAHGFTTGMAVGYGGGTYYLALSNSVDTLAIGVVGRVYSANAFELVLVGLIDNSSLSLTPGQYYYVSGTVGGGLDVNDTALVSQPILIGLTATAGYVLPYRPTVESDPDYASATQDGIVSVAAQTFAGLKTFQNGIVVADGSAAAPSISFGSSQTTGAFRKAPGSMGWSSAGTEIGSFASGGAWTFGSTTATTANHEVQANATGAVFKITGYGSGGAYLRIVEDGVQEWFQGMDNGSSVFKLRPTSLATASVAECTTAGSWTFGSGATSNIAHTFLGRATDGTTFYNTVFRCEGTSYQIKMERTSTDAGFSYIGGDGVNAFYVRSQTGAALGTVSQNGTWTIGTPASENLTNGKAHLIFGGLNAGETGTGDGARRFILNSNCHFAGNASVNTRLNPGNNSLTGGAIQLHARSQNTDPTIQFYANSITDSTTTTATLVGQCSGAGEWRLLPTTGAVQNFVFGAGASGTGTILTGRDLGHNLGSSSNRYNAVFAASSTIQTSDERLKKNIQPMGPALARVIQMEPSTWESKYETYFVGTSGFVAQHLETVFPELVQTQPDTIEGHTNIKTVSVAGPEMAAVLVKAIQELKADLDAAKAEIALLKAG